MGKKVWKYLSLCEELIEWVFLFAVEEFWPTLYKIVLIQTDWIVFEHEWPV